MSPWLSAGPLALALVVGGCALPWPHVTAPPPRPRAPAVTLVVGHVVAEPDRPVAEAVAALVAEALRRERDVETRAEFQARAAALGRAAWAEPVLARLEAGAWPDALERDVLHHTLGVSTVLLVRVTRFEQVWGRYAKFTRAAVEVDLFELPVGGVTARVRREVEVERRRGRAFRYVLERAAEEVAAALRPEAPASFTELWLAPRR
jgi:hypothetical protein